ncbi:MAG: hypothetical protein ACD_2C00181G0002 [uncultured bacterium (gcode 4)]|uniref:Uncharacterized protein n=1 Tax=uncultured bacterium (gcode 4) TaxID=1234023 RepID=K2GG69_9BACT|nr:MAG: hypothetical protein ACD_2C00181G0002 [uncultured bacterium (gcode 4)]
MAFDLGDRLDSQKQGSVDNGDAAHKEVASLLNFHWDSPVLKWSFFDALKQNQNIPKDSKENLLNWMSQEKLKILADSSALLKWSLDSARRENMARLSDTFERWIW